MKHIASAVAAAILAAHSGAPANAELAPEDVWASWRDTAASMGQTLEAADTVASAGALTLTGVSMSMTAPDGNVRMLIDEVVLTDLGDGTVAIEASQDYALRIESSADGETFAMDFSISHESLEAVAAGDPEALSYVYSADGIELALIEATANGEPMDMDVAAALDGVRGTYDVTAGDPRTIDSAMGAEAMALSVRVNDPDEGVNIDLAMTLEDLSSTSAGTMSPFAAGQDLAELLRSGLSSDGTFSYAAARYELDATGPDGPVVVLGSAATGTIDARLDADGLRYGGSNTDVELSVTAPGQMMPPVNLSIAETEGELMMPLVASEEVQDFGLSLTLDGVALGEEIWSLIDPAGALPRDPAAVALDVTGKGQLKFDLPDAEQVPTDAEEIGSVDRIDINQLALSLAGADLTGTGAFTFDNTASPPQPSGQVDLRLEGANALIDRLVQIGVIPEDQAMQARLMLGLFARPGDGEDTLVSTIEVREDGAVIANGQRIR